VEKKREKGVGGREKEERSLSQKPRVRKERRK
jgi:hypothetical protein